MFSAVAVLFAAVTLTLTSVSDVAARTARPGAPSVGDYLFPGLGNGGYDARHYTVKLRYPTTAPAHQVRGTVTMDAVASQDLSSLNLDFAGDEVTSVRINGRSARFDWQRKAEELVITPSRALRRGSTFRVEVAFAAHPTVPASDDVVPVGWIATPHGSFTSFQPDTAHQALPINDHPSDKATFRFELDVPEGVTGVANGEPTGRRDSAGRTVWSYAERSPLATELIQLAVGEDLSIVGRGSVAGVAYRDVISKVRRDLLEQPFAQGPAQVKWAVDKVGKFPHAVYGNLGVNTLLGYALETQGLSLHSYGLFDPTFIPGRSGQPWFYEPVMVHEVAHEWFGNSVSPERWSDLWLNEGWATWMMTEFEAETGVLDEWGYGSFEEYMRAQYAQGDSWRNQFGPVARPSSAEVLFSPNVYDGGALVLYALQQRVGEQTFEAIQRGWADRFAGRSVGTEDFIRYASRVSGQDLTSFLEAWLYGQTTPPMPGHPGWTVVPAAPAASADNTRRTATAGPHDWFHGRVNAVSAGIR